jgi:hypothetical protein
LIQLKIVSLLIFTVLAGGCCSNVSKGNENVGIINNQGQQNPASIKENISIVTGVIEEIYMKTEIDYILKLKINKADESAGYPSIAVSGSSYLLAPNFRIDDGSMIDNDVNNGLKMLSKFKKGDKVKLEISFAYPQGWIIQKFLGTE